MNKRIKDMKNKKYGRLKGLEYLYTGNDGAYWLFECDCGNKKVINGSVVRTRKVVSCGCYANERRIEVHTKHGMANSKTYSIWEGMKQRCLNPNSDNYKNYGARGISLDPKWIEFEGFFEDMGECPKGYSIERIDNNKGYTKSNCIWANRSKQNINKRYKNKTTGIRNISYNKKDDAFEVGICRNRKRYRKTFKKLEDAIRWKEEKLKELDNKFND